MRGRWPRLNSKNRRGVSKATGQQGEVEQRRANWEEAMGVLDAGGQMRIDGGVGRYEINKAEQSGAIAISSWAFNAKRFYITASITKNRDKFLQFQQSVFATA